VAFLDIRTVGDNFFGDFGDQTAAVGANDGNNEIFFCHENLPFGMTRLYNDVQPYAAARNIKSP
jgi:hypothetical protein